MKNLIIYTFVLWFPWLAFYFPICLLVWLFSAEGVTYSQVVGNDIGLAVMLILYIALYLPLSGMIHDEIGGY